MPSSSGEWGVALMIDVTLTPSRMKTEDRDWTRIGARANEVQAKVISTLNASARQHAVPDVSGAAEFFQRALSVSDEVMAAGDGDGAAASASNFADVELEVDMLHQATHQARQYSLQATRFLDGIFSSLAADLRSQDDAGKLPSTDSDGPDAVALLSAAGSTQPSSRADPMHMLRALAAADASQQTPETLAKAASVAHVTATPRRPSANVGGTARKAGGVGTTPRRAGVYGRGTPGPAR